MAEALLRLKLEQRGVHGVTVSSAGTGAWDGAPASEGAYLVGLEHEVDLSSHRARLLTRELLNEADLVLTMAHHHRARVEQLGTGVEALLLGEYAGEHGAGAEVHDPFGGDLEGYRETWVQLEQLVDGVIDRLARERSGDRR